MYLYRKSKAEMSGRVEALKYPGINRKAYQIATIPIEIRGLGQI